MDKIWSSMAVAWRRPHSCVRNYSDYEEFLRGVFTFRGFRRSFTFSIFVLVADSFPILSDTIYPSIRSHLVSRVSVDEISWHPIESPKLKLRFAHVQLRESRAL